MAPSADDFEALKIQFYAVSAVLAFIVIVLIAVVIHLFVKVSQLKNGDEYEDDDESEENETTQRPQPPPVKSGFSFPKPNVSKNWHNDDDADIRRQNEQKEFNVPKPAISKSWQAYPGERDRNQPKRNQDYRHDDNASNYSYDGNGKNSGGAFRNPLSGHNEYADNRPDRQPKVPGFRLPAISGSNFNQGGHDNQGFRRDFQRNNNYY